jgi:voltage-gated potassium channel
MEWIRKLKNRIYELQHDEALKRKLYVIIFESDTPLGKAFDVALMVFIVLSILVVVAESLQGWKAIIGPYLVVLEYVFTFFFTLEYLMRLYCSPQPRKYALSFFGLVDLLSTLPFYIGWIFGPVRYLLIIRTFRLIRVFRVFKLFSFLNEGDMLLRSLAISSRKIGVFFLFVLILVISIGTLMYMIEGQVEGSAFRDIPSSIYWAIVTLTTVGYGDITPVTSMGRFLSAIVMLLGYTIIAVPTGIVSASMVSEHRKQTLVRCPHCGQTGHDEGAKYCKFCGAKLEEEEIQEEEPESRE